MDKEDKEQSDYRVSLCPDTKYTTGSPDYEVLFFMVAGAGLVRR